MAKTIFITGASSGIGKASAKLFASKGWNVLATMRNPDKETELNKIENITLLPLDVTDLNGITDIVQKVTENNTIDVVLNNAGYGTVGALEGTTDEQLQQIVNTNLLGVIRTTKAFIPHFREKENGVFITITSIGGLVAFPFFSLYHATKWALEGWTESMAFELKRFGVSIKTVSPGGTATDFAGRSLVTISNPAYNDSYNQFWKRFVNPDFMANLSSPAQIADVIYEAATDGKEQLRYLAGKDAIETYEQRLQAGAEKFHVSLDKTFFGEEGN